MVEHNKDEHMQDDEQAELYNKAKLNKPIKSINVSSRYRREEMNWP